MNITLKQRKIALLSAIGILAVIFIIQQIFLHRSPVELFELEEEADTITVTRGDEVTSLYKDGDTFTVGKKHYKAAEYVADPFFTTLKQIKTIATVTSSTAESENERYGFTPNSQIKVEAKKDGRVLRTLLIGKKASSGSQTYIRVDGSTDTLLASTNLKDIYSTKTEDIRDREIYSVESSDILSVEVTQGKNKFTVLKEPDGNWGGIKDASSSKISSWINSISTLDTGKWAADDTELTPAGTEKKVTLKTASRTIELYFEAGEKDDSDWLVKSSASEYCFYVTAQAAKKFLKEEKDLR